MALNPHWGLGARKAALDAAMNLANSGSLVIYSGSQPANADTAVGAQVALATFALANPAFAAAGGSAGSSATKVLNLPASVAAAAGAGTGTLATWFRIYESDGVTAVADGSVGTATADLVINAATIVAGATVSITSVSEYLFGA